VGELGAVGAVGSVGELGAARIAHEKVSASLNVPSVTLAVTENVPAALGVPLMNPVPATSESPGGREDAP